MMRSHFKSISKAISWRLLGAIDTFGLTLLMTGRLSSAVGVVGFEVVTKTALYYGHERAWELSWITNLFSGELS